MEIKKKWITDSMDNKVDGTDSAVTALEAVGAEEMTNVQDS